jgi:phospholipase/carboxylesterase
MSATRPGSLLEYATDAPGFTVDEAPEDLGKTLFVPPHDAARADDLRVILPQFALPGEERTPMRDLHFVHRFHRPRPPMAAPSSCCTAPAAMKPT